MNSDYKKLAYERTVLLALVGLAREHLLPLEGEEEPQRRLDCEELTRNESAVPEDTIIDVVVKLQRLAKNRELEMSKFNHVLSERSDEQEWSEDSPTPQPSQKGSGTTAGKGKSKGSSGNQKAAGPGLGGSKPTHPTAQQTNAAGGGRA